MVVESTEAEGRALFDREARTVLGISGEEFLDHWDAGDYADWDDPESAGLVMLIPFGR
ncbi:hypothetical protein [Acrocarpospora sp. B8E8]|uniref:hypothetical protein n=1 Tax=Acrocarpospora sp. B8E8 TaxID=3153572 RepID=UPI00325CE2D5